MSDPAAAARPTGLSHAEAARRLAQDGPNELPAGRRLALGAIVIDVLSEPMLLLLLAAGAIYLVLGEPRDAVVLMVFAGLTTLIAVVQELRSERAIEALREFAMPHAAVIRAGERVVIPSREVVRGDLLVVGEGARLTADGWLVEGQGLSIDEALLTGESVPVGKTVLAGPMPSSPPPPGGEGLPYAWAGTMAVRGSGLMQVAATGAATRIGEIGLSLARLENEPPRLVVQTRRLVRWFAVIGLGVSVLAGVLFALLRGGWLDGALVGIALAMSMLPEELPIVLALFMTMGALRMAGARVLARRGAAIETLGAASVLCTDKTGTLTQNRMEIAELRLPGGESFEPVAGVSFPEAFRTLASRGILACPREPSDPMELAFHGLAKAHPAAALDAHHQDGWALHRHYELRPDLLAMSQVWGSDGEAARLIAAKGAPEAIAELCSLPDDQCAAMEAQVAAMAERGLRVLGVAEALWGEAALPESQRHFAFAFVGLVGLADPVRPSVPPAVDALQQAGLRVVMITGDYPATAAAIAAQAGIAAGEVMTGEELARIDDDELARRVGTVAVFARAMPEHKLRIVRALKAAGEVVAMIGDGVNDAPSLKAAHIGVAMGQRGTDVAREAAGIVLLDDDFGSIVAALRLGRRIYDNVRKAIGFIIAVHVPIAGLALLPLLTGWPLILGPVQIALLELVIDPVCTLAFEAEAEEDDLMRRPPRDPASALVSPTLLGWALLQGGAALALLTGLAVAANLSGMGADLARATTFAALVAALVVLIFANRSFAAGRGPGRAGRNAALAVILGVVGALCAGLFLVPPVAALFGLPVLDVRSLGAAGLAAALLYAVLRLAKPRFRPAFTR